MIGFPEAVASHLGAMRDNLAIYTMALDALTEVAAAYHVDDEDSFLYLGLSALANELNQVANAMDEIIAKTKDK